MVCTLRADFDLKMKAIFAIIILLSHSQATEQNGKKPATSVNLHIGREGTLPCGVNVESYVQWSKDRPALTPPDPILIFMDLYVDVTKGGQGYENGVFDITDDSSLVIRNVSFGDEGQYFCVAFDFSTGVPLWHATNVTVYALPVHKFPQITECNSSSDGSVNSQNCTHYSKERTANVTCSVIGYYPSADIFFSYQSRVVPVLHSQELLNSDGTKNQSVTVLAHTSSDPYMCVVTELQASDGMTERSATIRLTWKPDISQDMHNRPREIAMIVALFFFSSICPLIFFCVERLKGRVFYLTEAQAEECWRELREFYISNYQWIKAGPLNPGPSFGIKKIFTDVFFQVKSNSDVSNTRIPRMFVEEEFQDEATKDKVKLYMNDFVNKIILSGRFCRILLVGEAGIGKTTCLLKLVDEWSTGGGKMKKFKFLFYVPLSIVENNGDMNCVYQLYMLHSLPKFVRLNRHFKRHQNDIIFLFDGLDEFHGDLTQHDPNNDFVRIMRGEKYPNSTVIVTTRPWCKDHILADEELNSLFTVVTLKGFDQKNTKAYVKKFFTISGKSATGLIQFLEDDSKERGVFFTMVSSSPIYLTMLCLMWQNLQGRQDEVQELQAVSQLIRALMDTLVDYYIRSRNGSDFQKLQERVRKSLIQVGRIAYQAVMKNKHFINKDDHSDCLNSIEIAKEVGVLVLGAHGRFSRGTGSNRYRFTHMLVRDYLAALYLESECNTGEVGRQIFEEALQNLMKESEDDIDKFAFLWYCIAARGGDVSRNALRVLTQSPPVTITRNFIFQVAFECHDKDITDPFTAPLLEGKALRLDQKTKHLAAYLYVLDNANTKLESLHHFTDELGPSVSERYARNVCSMTSLKVLRLVSITLDDAFYKTMAQEAHPSKLETLIISNPELQLSEESSRQLARTILVIKTLRNLRLVCGSLHARFYETFNEGKEETKVTKA